MGAEIAALVALVVHSQKMWISFWNNMFLVIYYLAMNRNYIFLCWSIALRAMHVLLCALSPFFQCATLECLSRPLIICHWFVFRSICPRDSLDRHLPPPCKLIREGSKDIVMSFKIDLRLFRLLCLISCTSSGCPRNLFRLPAKNGETLLKLKSGRKLGKGVWAEGPYWQWSILHSARSGMSRVESQEP